MRKKYFKIFFLKEVVSLLTLFSRNLHVTKSGVFWNGKYIFFQKNQFPLDLLKFPKKPALFQITLAL